MFSAFTVQAAIQLRELSRLVKRCDIKVILQHENPIHKTDFKTNQGKSVRCKRVGPGGRLGVKIATTAHRGSLSCFP